MLATRTAGKSTGIAAEASAWVGSRRVGRGTMVGSRVQRGSVRSRDSMKTTTWPVPIWVAATQTASTSPCFTLGRIERQGIARITSRSSGSVLSRP